MTERCHPLDALAEALVTVVYRESQLESEEAWADERRRLDELKKEAANRTRPRRTRGDARVS